MKRTGNFRLSFFHFFGVFIIITGIFLMWCAYNGSGAKNISVPENNNSEEADEDIEELEAYYSSIKNRSDTAFRMSLVVLGGLCIMGGIPVFYVSRADTLQKFPQRSKYPKNQVPEEEEFDDFEFDNYEFDGYYKLDDDIMDSIKINESVMDIIKRNYKKNDEK